MWTDSWIYIDILIYEYVIFAFSCMNEAEEMLRKVGQRDADAPPKMTRPLRRGF